MSEDEPERRLDPSASEQLEAVRAAFACGHTGCTCSRPKSNVHCPAHNDTSPSLSVTVGPDGKTLVHCHGGCSQEAVIDALRERGLWPERGATSLGARPAAYGEESISCWYDYYHRDGRLSYIVGRTPSKQFPCYHSNDRGTWKGGYGGQRILYRLPELLAADPASSVLLVEGEKDADRARTEGFVATTTPGGAGKAHLCDLSPLQGRHIVIIPDNDEAGTKHGADLVKLLAGIAASIKVVNLAEAAQ